MFHKTTTCWAGGMIFESDNPSGNKFTMDSKPGDGRTQKGLSPKALMLSSLAGCTGIDIVDILKKMKIKNYGLKIVVEGELTDKHPKYYNSVNIKYYFSGDGIDSNKCRRAVELSVKKYCGVMEMFRQFAKVKTDILFH
tara:strand:- start:76 stop:492 length:417 start_codon:yes stop_codon:yes gene_type:complete